MSRLDIIQKLGELSQKKMDAVAQDLALLQQQCTVAEEKLALLRQYSGDYERQLEARSGRGMEVSILRDYQRFIKQLENAIQIQAFEVARHQRFCAEGLARWMAARRAAKGFETLTVRHLAADHLKALKKAQKEMDEWSQRARAGLQVA